MDLKKRESFIKDPSPELSWLKRVAERDVYAATLPDTRNSQKQPTRPWPLHIHREMAWPGKEEEGREQEVIHLVSRDSPGKESQPLTSLASQSIQSLALPAPPTLVRKQEVCTLNLTGASVLCCAYFLYTLNP